MGNCNQNFEDVGDESYIEHFEVSHRPLPSQEIRHASIYQEQPPSYLIDQEAIHNTHLRKQEQIPEAYEEEAQPVQGFPLEPEVDISTSHQARKVRPKLQELDLTFYHSLGLEDYVYQPIPEKDRDQYEGVETYELKDNYGVKYVGEWLDNHIHGNGVLLSNTAKYIGQFKRGLKHYHGRQILKNEVYEGEFQGGRRKGNGVRYTDTTTEKGLFDDEFIEGEIMYLDGRVEAKGRRREDRANESFRTDNLNQTIGSLYTDKYYEGSELPSEWNEEQKQQRMGNGADKKESFYYNKNEDQI